MPITEKRTLFEHKWYVVFGSQKRNFENSLDRRGRKARPWSDEAEWNGGGYAGSRRNAAAEKIPRNQDSLGSRYSRLKKNMRDSVIRCICRYLTASMDEISAIIRFGLYST